MYGYIHRVAYYNGFKRLSHFISHITGETCSRVRTKELMASASILEALTIAVRQPLGIYLNQNCRSSFDSKAFTQTLLICPCCFSNKPVLKNEWLYQYDSMCHEHGMPLFKIEGVKLNTQNVIDWGRLGHFCQKLADLDRGSILENIAYFHENYGIGVHWALDSYFQQRQKEIILYAKLGAAQSKRLPRINRASSKKDYQKIFHVLRDHSFASQDLIYQLVYWGFVDPLLEIEHLGIGAKYFAFLKKGIDYCMFEFIKDFPPRENTPLYSDTRYPDAFHQLKAFRSDFEYPSLKLLDSEEIEERAGTIL